VPAELGPWWRAAQLFIRWSKLGVWPRLLEAAQERGVGLGMAFLDGTSIRAHAKAAGAPRKGGARPARGARPLARRARDQGARRRRRGRTGRGPHGRAGPSPRAADRAGAPRPAAARAALGRRRPGLQLARPPRPDPVRARGARPAIPTRSNEAAVACPDFIYTNRNLVERLWARLKEWRAVATRYEKTAASFTGVLCLAAALDWLKP
jgi:transposase